jgi:glycosyltransferase involved in cell wall biosynthesis
MPHAHILLGTYEGAAYLPELLLSIQAQTERNWTLWTRDDDSRDTSPQIVRRAAAADPRIVVFEGDCGRLGPAGNYGALLQRAHQAGAEYLFFADQDDVWLPDKLQKQMEVFEREERGEQGCVGPLPRLVYSDMLLADERLRPLGPSFLASSRLCHGEGRPMATLLGRNFVPGCACGFNRPVAELALPMPAVTASPDWWVALCAVAIGRISYLPEATVRYRRHAGTVSGPAAFWSGLNPLRYSWRQRWQAGLDHFRRSLCQARTLRDRLRERGAEPDEVFGMLDRFCGVFAEPEAAWRRIGRLRRLGIPAIDRARRLCYYLCVLRLGREAVLGSPQAACLAASSADCRK